MNIDSFSVSSAWTKKKFERIERLNYERLTLKESPAPLSSVKGENNDQGWNNNYSKTRMWCSLTLPYLTPCMRKLGLKITSVNLLINNYYVLLSRGNINVWRCTVKYTWCGTVPEHLYCGGKAWGFYFWAVSTFANESFDATLFVLIGLFFLYLQRSTIISN